MFLPMLRSALLGVPILLLFLGSASSGSASLSTACLPVEQGWALVNGTLIDGTGATPISDAVVVIEAGRIAKCGPRARMAVPAGLRVVDVKGGTILPGFINAHVHEAFDAARLEAWAAAGVTTVRDENILLPLELRDALAFRDRSAVHPKRARLISAGMMLSPPQGYGRLFVDSPAAAVKAVEEEIDAGVDLIKLSLEDGYAGKSGLPKFSDEDLAAIVRAAHHRGKKVSAHVTQAKFMDRVVRAGVDDVAHISYDVIPDELIRRMVEAKVVLTPTFSVLRAYRALFSSVPNLRRFVAAGGLTALGNDYTSGPGGFELGMPWFEIEKMLEAGMSALQIIVASTRNGASACGREMDLGTVEAGKIADLLVIDGDPLADLKALGRVRLVVHGGVAIVGRGPAGPAVE